MSNKVDELIKRTNELTEDDKAKLEVLFRTLMGIKDLVDQEELRNCIEAEVIIH